MKYLVAILFLILFASCAFERKLTTEIKSSITNRFEIDNGIENLINIDGYYKFQYPLDLTDGFGYGDLYVDEFSNSNVLFFKDGTYTESITFKNGVIKEDISKDFQASLFKGIGNWGIYNIHNDTLIVQKIRRPSTQDRWNITETTIKVIDRNTLKILYVKYLYTELDIETNKIFYSDVGLGNFFPANNLPGSDNWLKKEKWLWKDATEWELYMKKRIK